MNEALVIIPTYNEKENIEDIIRKVFSLSHPFDILVIDDNSEDSTADIVKGLQTEPGFRDQLHLIVREGKLGLGTAYIEGFKYALEKEYQYVIEMDADFSHNPLDLPQLCETCSVKGFDVAIGSRYISGVNVVNWPLSRVLLSIFASIYVRLITGMPVQDPTAGYVCYMRHVLETLNLDKVKFIGYAFQIEMKYFAWKAGFSLKEIPIIFRDRTRGKSKLSTSILKEAVFGVIWMKLTNYRKMLIRKKEDQAV